MSSAEGSAGEARQGKAAFFTWSSRGTALLEMLLCKDLLEGRKSSEKWLKSGGLE